MYPPRRSRLTSQFLSFLKFILVLSAVWTIGYCGLSVAWVCVAGVFIYIWLFEGKEFSLMHPLVSLQRLRGDCEVDQGVWLTKIFTKLWPYSKNRIDQFLRSQLQSSIRSNLPSTLQSFTFTTIELGNEVPEVLAVEVKESDKSYVILDMEILYNSDADIGVSIGKFESSIRELQVHGTFRIVLTDLHNSWPFFGKMNLSFVSPPTLNFRLAKAASLFDVAGFRDIIHEKILDQLTCILVLPHYITVPISNHITDSTAYPLPQGVLRIQINRAKDLPYPEGRDDIEPYCMVQIGATRYKTGVIQKTNQPIWNDTFEFLVHDANQQYIEIQCIDASVTTGSGSLGNTCLNLATFNQYNNKSLVFPLEKDGPASISVTCTWLELSGDMSQLQDEQLSGSQWLSTAIVVVGIDSASNLPKGLRSLSKPSSYVKVALNGKEYQTNVSPNSNNPLWRENFFFFSSNPDKQDVEVQVVDSITEGLLGTATIPLHKLIDAIDVTSHTLKLLESGGEATLKVNMTLRALVPVKQIGNGEPASSSNEKRDTGNIVIPKTFAPTVSTPIKMPRQFSKPASLKLDESSDNENSDIFDLDNWSETESNIIAGGATYIVISRPDGSTVSEIVQNSDETAASTTTRPVDVDETKYGQIQTTIRYSSTNQRLVVVIHKCRNLKVMKKDKESAPDPFVVLTLYNNKSKLDRKKTKHLKSSYDPVFDETFDFKLPKPSVETALVELRIKNRKKMFQKGKSNIGNVVLKLNALDLSEPRTDWFLIRNIKSSSESLNELSMISRSEK